jgi:hypothetical protein
MMVVVKKVITKRQKADHGKPMKEYDQKDEANRVETAFSV